MRRHEFGARMLAVALSLVVVAGASFEQHADTADTRSSFVISVDLNGDGHDEILVGLCASSEPHIAEFSAPGDVCVFAREDSATPGSDWRLVFQCRSSIPEAYHSGFFQPTLISTSDIDGDSLAEATIVWYEQSWWPTAYRPISVLQFNQVEGTYELVIDPTRFVGEIGGYAIDDIDADGVPEILEIDPIYGTEIDPATGSEEWECHYCPHQYGIRALQFNGTGFLPESTFNNGELYVTPDKYCPEVAWEAISAFLPDLLVEARSVVHEDTSSSCR